MKTIKNICITLVMGLIFSCIPANKSMAYTVIETPEVVGHNDYTISNYGMLCKYYHNKNGKEIYNSITSTDYSYYYDKVNDISYRGSYEPISDFVREAEEVQSAIHLYQQALYGDTLLEFHFDYLEQHGITIQQFCSNLLAKYNGTLPNYLSIAEADHFAFYNKGRKPILAYAQEFCEKVAEDVYVPLPIVFRYQEKESKKYAAEDTAGRAIPLCTYTMTDGKVPLKSLDYMAMGYGWRFESFMKYNANDPYMVARYNYMATLMQTLGDGDPNT